MMYSVVAWDIMEKMHNNSYFSLIYYKLVLKYECFLFLNAAFMYYYEEKKSITIPLLHNWWRFQQKSPAHMWT